MVRSPRVWNVIVPADYVVPAQAFVAESRLTDAELTYLSTGVLDANDGSK